MQVLVCIVDFDAFHMSSLIVCNTETDNVVLKASALSQPLNNDLQGTGKAFLDLLNTVP